MAKILPIWPVGMDMEKPELFKKASFKKEKLKNLQFYLRHFYNYIIRIYKKMFNIVHIQIES